MTLERPVAAILVALLAAATFANILNAGARRLSAGATFDVDGSQFGSRPTAWLDVSGRRVPLKVAKGGSDTRVVVRLPSVPRGVSGACMLEIRPRGSKVAFGFSGMSIELPAPAGTTPASGSAGTEVTIDGSYFGNRRGRVEFGSRAGRVLEWSDTEIRVVVPRHLAAGTVNLHVVNQAGSSAKPTGFEILP